VVVVPDLASALRAGCRLGLLASLALVGVHSAITLAAGFDDDYEVRVWEEIEASLPPPPKESALIPFYVSAVSDNRFLVDGDSISVGADGVIRYTLVVLSSSGARNVSYEGIRCETAERRPYAFGRTDGSWSKARSNSWVRIQNATVNRQYAALFSEYFCPYVIPVSNADEARMALRSGGHPSLRR
jgi:hypothetical protein